MKYPRVRRVPGIFNSRAAANPRLTINPSKIRQMAQGRNLLKVEDFFIIILRIYVSNLINNTYNNIESAHKQPIKTNDQHMISTKL